jgi:hypothetical protein
MSLNAATSIQNSQTVTKPIAVNFIDAPIYGAYLFNKKSTFTYDNNDNRLTQNFVLTSAWTKPIVNLNDATTRKTIDYVYDFKNMKATRVSTGAYEGNMVYTFNEDGLVQSAESTKGLVHTQYTYDNYKRIKTSVVEYKHHDYTKKGKYTYNYIGQVTEYKWTTTPNINYSDKIINLESFGINKYSYFENGNIKEMETSLIFNADTKKEYLIKTSYTYDEDNDGRVLSIDKYSGKNKRNTHYQMDYDTLGNLITYIYSEVQNDGSFTKHTATYNEEGKLVSDYVEKN